MVLTMRKDRLSARAQSLRQMEHCRRWVDERQTDRLLRHKGREKGASLAKLNVRKISEVGSKAGGAAGAGGH